jgi:2-C-methyl-D-erythritol 4-phosphate cytidylyltransferase/2-C-methyl-D-erythritol 2,4-cyclodiphosphate synthase
VSEAGAAVPVVPIRDTVKRVQDARVVSTADRSEMRLVQTPQGFRRSVIEKAYRELGDADVTDEAQAIEQCGFDVTTVEGDPGNVKVTGSFDLELARLRVNRSLDLDASARVGTGNDCHRLVEGRALVLGGVEIPFDKGLDGFSDADVVTHAICDALLGAAAQGDIGQHFPPGDPRFEGISSLKLLARVAEILSKRGLRVGNVDATIVAQAPMLSPFIDDMRRTLSSVLGIDSEAVSIKATTTEGVGPEGTGLAMSATAVAIVRKAGPGQ